MKYNFQASHTITIYSVNIRSIYIYIYTLVYMCPSITSNHVDKVSYTRLPNRSMIWYLHIDKAALPDTAGVIDSMNRFGALYNVKLKFL